MSKVLQPVFDPVDMVQNCQPCSEQGNISKALNFCKECDEMLCAHCSSMHESQRITKTHVLVEINEIAIESSNSEESVKRKCEPCSNRENDVDAVAYCEECDEMLCEECTFIHSSQKLTKSHKSIPIDQINRKSLIPCEPCLETNTTTQAIKYCQFCDEALCEKCVIGHKSQKATKTHELFDVLNRSPDLKTNKTCEPCKINKMDRVASEVCIECEEFLCSSCVKQHKKQKATKGHKIMNASDIPSVLCDPCSESGGNINAIKWCKECDEALCGACVTQHKAQKATKDHQLQNSVMSLSDIKFCNPCTKSDKEMISIKYCSECEEYYCAKCSNIHGVQKATKSHKLTDAKLAKSTPGDEMMLIVQGSSLDPKTETIDSEPPLPQPKPAVLQLEKPLVVLAPGKPSVGAVNSDSVTLYWKPPTNFEESSYYQIRYKEGENRWTFYSESPERETATIGNLQANTTYVFQVRAVISDEEGPYSPESDKVQTKTSLASRLLEFTTKVKDGQPAKHQLHSTENKAARNERAKTRKFELGIPHFSNSKEKTILLVGATGSGKSTLVDGIINYVTGVNWKDPYRFTLVDLEEEEKNKNQAISQTEWITCYTINPEEGSRLNYRLNIIDTPGFGDTRGLERDNEIVRQLKELFSDEGQKGVVFIDAVCFLIKAPDARLTAVQKYIFMSILSLFGQDIEKNICTLITFADGNKPPVLAAMKEAKLPFNSWYVFNNSGLFASNEESKASLAPMFWDMGIQSFKQFFDCLNGMPTKSLQQTQRVLQERERLEITIQKLQPEVDAGLHKLHQLKQEIAILQKHENEIKDNKDFTYEVEETKQKKVPLPKGQHTTNCLHCNITCHKRCIFANDKDKYNCSAMKDGQCTVCDSKCSWKQHSNTPYIFTFKTEKVKKTYAEKLKMYEQAGENKVTHEVIINGMMTELDDLGNLIQDMMEQVNECNNILKTIALRPNPLTMVEHIDLMIQGEKLEKKNGFQDRIEVLHEYRKKAEIHKDLAKFKEEIKTTAKSSGQEKDGFWTKFKGLFTES